MPASKRISFISPANCRLSPLPYEVSGSTPSVSAFLHSVSVSIKQKHALRWLRFYVPDKRLPDISNNVGPVKSFLSALSPSLRRVVFLVLL